MAKGWTELAPRTKRTREEILTEQRVKNRVARKADNMIRATKSLSLEELKKLGDLHYEENKAAEDKLLAAFEDKRVKSKIAIKQAIKIKKDRAKAAKKAKAKAEKEVAKTSQPAPAETN